MDFSGPTAIRLRTIGRRLGILPPLVRAFRRLSGADMNRVSMPPCWARFVQAMSSGTSGANVGLYTEKFAARTGDAGRVACV